MLLNEAIETAERFIPLIHPLCDRIQVAGSVRRGKAEVKDIDLVVIEKTEGLINLAQFITTLGVVRINGPKIKRMVWEDKSIDIYSTTPEDFACTLLIRTGSAENNIRLCKRALEIGMHLSASGLGLFNAQMQRIAGDTEQSIYEALCLLYQEPADREVATARESDGATVVQEDDGEIG